MNKFIKSVILKVLGQRFGQRVINYLDIIFFSSGIVSYSQEGEDRFLGNMFKGKKTGFYVDLGAHHPYFLSNTQYFYQMGWRGLNIDANPDCIDLFHRFRKRDMNLVAGVGAKKMMMKFYRFDEAALSSFDEALALKRQASGRKIRSVINIEVKPLSEILIEVLPKETKIDFMSIDVEGLDLEVLKSNDWSKFRPQYILVECVGADIEKLFENETYQFLKNQNYHLFGKLINTCIFKDKF